MWESYLWLRNIKLIAYIRWPVPGAPYLNSHVEQAQLTLLAFHLWFSEKPYQMLSQPKSFGT